MHLKTQLFSSGKRNNWTGKQSKPIDLQPIIFIWWGMNLFEIITTPF